MQIAQRANPLEIETVSEVNKLKTPGKYIINFYYWRADFDIPSNAIYRYKGFIYMNIELPTFVAHSKTNLVFLVSIFTQMAGIEALGYYKV